MKKSIGALLIFMLAAMPASAETVEDLDKWFRAGYAALYVENSWDRADEFAQYFSDEIAVRSNDGLNVVGVDDFVVNQLDVWRNEGWLGTDVAALSTRRLNESTVLFDVKWRDRNNDGSTEDSCGWYIADRVGDKWLLSQYVSMACAD